MDRERLRLSHMQKGTYYVQAGWWVSSDTPVSSSNKTDSHNIAEILLKVTLNTMTLT
jgi:hypothetical protein